jgi:hypothetical protein
LRFEELRGKNRLPVYSVCDSGFRAYGAVLDNDFSTVERYLLEKTTIPDTRNVYVAHDDALGALPVSEQVRWAVFGGGEIQTGYCNGNTHALDALEWHACPEVNYAATDLVLMLARYADIAAGRIDSGRVRLFYLPRGTAVSLFAGTLHFAPCAVDAGGFKCLVILTRGTNLPLPERENRPGRLLRLQNKWMLCHRERPDLIASGAAEGIDGENLKLIY